MRKLVVLSFISLDGVMQAPGGPDEDTSGGFKYGGWTFPFFDKLAGNLMGEQMSGHADLLLGRKTFEIFAGYWPEHAAAWPGINEVTKYVASNTLDSSEWGNTVFLKGDVVEEVRRLKQQDGADLQVHGSGALIQTLLENNLVDELWIKTFPVTLGVGKKLFAEGTRPAAFKLLSSEVTPSGVIFANYRRAGEVKTGTLGS
jgi:dihydrofolate reductase